MLDVVHRNKARALLGLNQDDIIKFEEQIAKFFNAYKAPLEAHLYQVVQDFQLGHHERVKVRNYLCALESLRPPALMYSPSELKASIADVAEHAPDEKRGEFSIILRGFLDEMHAKSVAPDISFLFDYIRYTRKLWNIFSFNLLIVVQLKHWRSRLSVDYLPGLI